MTSDSYQESLFTNIDYELTENLKILYKEYPYFNYFKNDYLKSNIEYINQQLNDQRLIKADYLSNNETNEFKILIDNYGDFPIRIIGLFQGDNLIFAAFGGGFTWGSIYLKWAYNK